MPRPKRLEKLRIWWPVAASRAGVLREVREVAGVPEGAGRWRWKIEKADAGKFEMGGKKDPVEI
jgi:hypothetical protein